MRIQHNIMAMSAYRNYTNNVSAMKKNLEKLSSGYKINRAGDDAAGLAISEKMRAQITGLQTAQKNAKDGISLVQTAEGALTEVHDMLNRMVELATMSANGTYDDTTDRNQLQKEMDQLRSEINRISESSNFNGIKLLDGSMDAGGGSTIGSFELPGEGDTLGRDTLLRGPGEPAAKSSFTLALDTLSWNATSGDTLEIKLGNDTITVTAGATTSYDAAAIADMVKTAFNDNPTITGATASVSGTHVTFAASVNGDTFAVNRDITMTVKFADGTTPDQTRDISQFARGVQGRANNKTAAVTSTPGQAAGTPGFTTGTAQTGVSATIAGSSYTIDWTSSTSADQSALSGNTVSVQVNSKTYTVTLMASGSATTANVTAGIEVELAVTATGDAPAALLSKIQAALQTQINAANATGASGTASYVKVENLEITGTTAGALTGTVTTTQQTYSDGTGTSGTAEINFSGVTGADMIGDTITISGTTYEFVNVGGPATAGAVAVTVTLTATGDDLATALNTALGTPSGYTAAVSGSKVTLTAGVGQSIAVSATDFVDGGGEEENKVDLSTELAGLSMAPSTPLGAAATALANTTASLTVSNSDIKTSFAISSIMGDITASSTIQDVANAIKAKVEDIVRDWEAGDGASATYTYTVDVTDSEGTSLVSRTANPGEFRIVLNQVPKSGDEGGVQGLHGNFNAASVNNVKGSDGGSTKYASTTFNLSQMGEIGEGSQITIAGETYTFKEGDSFGVSGNTITLSKHKTGNDRLEEAARGMSQMHNNNFTIGSENPASGKIVLNEVGTSGAPNADVVKKLGTVKDFQSLISFKAVTPTDTTGTKGLKLQIGDTADDYNQLIVSIGSCDTKSLGIDSISIAEQGDAQSAIDAIKAAINKVSDIRGTLGATQNRLDHTINNLSVMTENIQDAESTIRDVDVAEEMMAYTKNNILIQSAQAMLAQANQVPQGVLQLLG